MNFENLDLKVVVIKIGTSTITKGDNGAGLNFSVVNQLAQASHELIEQGYQVAIVTSGAMGLGINKLGFQNIQKHMEAASCKEDYMSFKQALTAIGQVDLMNAYENIFRNYEKQVGQVLITHKGLDDEERNDIIKNTLSKMFILGVTPVINANDTVTFTELDFGDNDSLAARIAVLTKAERLVVLTDAKGFYDKDPHKNSDAKLIKKVEEITDELKELAGGSSTHIGLGGMKSKLMAAELCMKQGIPTDIIGVDQIPNIPKIINKQIAEVQGTQFIAA